MIIILADKIIKKKNHFWTRWRHSWTHFASSHDQKKDNNKFKNKNNQNCQTVELYGSPTTKELKKKHSSRPVGRAEIGSWGGKDLPQGGS